MDLNSFFLIGRLTADVEVKYTPTGAAIGRLRLANNQRMKKNGQFVDTVSFFDVTVFGNENLFQYLTKGKQLAITGTLRQDRWQDQTGNNHSKISFIATNIQLVGGATNANGANTGNSNPNTGAHYNAMPPQQAQQPQYQQTPPAQNNAAQNYDEIPEWVF